MRAAAVLALLGLLACSEQDRAFALPDAPVAPGVDADSLIPTVPPDAPPPVRDEELVAACGELPVTLADWEDCYAKRTCEWEVGCVIQNAYRDVAECHARRDAVVGGRLSAERRERERAVEDGRAAVDPQQFARCLIATSGDRCNTALTEPACLTRYTGTIADGGACLTAVDCASPDATCESDCDDACCLGTCRPKAELGAACTEFDSCEPGLRCHRTCLAGDVGSACLNNRGCDSNAWCDPAAGVCKADFPEGAACTSILQCGGTASCVGLSITSSEPGRCQRVSRAGDECDGICYGNLICAGTTCRKLPVLGEPCAGIGACGGVDAMCNGQQCVRRSEAGATCGAQTCLPGLFCTSELGAPQPACAARGEVGDACADPAHCDSYLCSGSPGAIGACLPWEDACPIE